MPRINSIDELEKLRQEIVALRDPKKPCVSICAGAGCIASGADEVITAFEAEIEKQGLKAASKTIWKGGDGMDTNNAKREVSRRTFIKTTITTAASLTFSSWGVPTLLRA